MKTEYTAQEIRDNDRATNNKIIQSLSRRVEALADYASIVLRQNELGLSDTNESHRLKQLVEQTVFGDT